MYRGAVQILGGMKHPDAAVAPKRRTFRQHANTPTAVPLRKQQLLMEGVAGTAAATTSAMRPLLTTFKTSAAIAATMTATIRRSLRTETTVGRVSIPAGTVLRCTDTIIIARDVTVAGIGAATLRAMAMHMRTKEEEEEEAVCTETPLAASTLPHSTASTSAAAPAEGMGGAVRCSGEGGRSLRRRRIGATLATKPATVTILLTSVLPTPTPFPSNSGGSDVSPSDNRPSSQSYPRPRAGLSPSLGTPTTSSIPLFRCYRHAREGGRWCAYALMGRSTPTLRRL